MNARKVSAPPPYEEPDPSMPGFTKAETVHDRIRVVREWRGFTQKELSDAIAGRGGGKRARSSVSQWERGQSVPPHDKLILLAKFLRVRPAYLAFGDTMQPVEVAPDPDKLGYAIVPEVTFESPNKVREGSSWGLPTSFLRNEINCPTLDKLVIFKVEGSSIAEYEAGDRVVVDLNHTKVSPAGHYLLWDGFGPTIAHVSVTHGAKLTLRVKTDTDSYEIAPEKLQVLGRIRGMWKKA